AVGAACVAPLPAASASITARSAADGACASRALRLRPRAPSASARSPDAIAGVSTARRRVDLELLVSDSATSSSRLRLERRPTLNVCALVRAARRLRYGVPARKWRKRRAPTPIKPPRREYLSDAVRRRDAA